MFTISQKPVHDHTSSSSHILSLSSHCPCHPLPLPPCFLRTSVMEVMCEVRVRGVVYATGSGKQEEEECEARKKGPASTTTVLILCGIIVCVCVLLLLCRSTGTALVHCELYSCSCFFPCPLPSFIFHSFYPPPSCCILSCPRSPVPLTCQLPSHRKKRRRVRFL